MKQLAFHFLRMVTLGFFIARSTTAAEEAPSKLDIRPIEPNSFAIHRAGSEAPLIVVDARPDFRPHIHPIYAPDGSGVLSEAPAPNYNWHLGLWFGLNNVNKQDFWSKNEHFHPKALSPPKCEGNRAAFTIEDDWQTYNGPPGKPGRALKDKVLTETQHWTFTDHGSYYILDLNWKATAGKDVTFGKSDYGGLFIRTVGGRNIRNSEGDTNSKQSPEATEGKRARWVLMEDSDKSRGGKNAYVVIMDHKDNTGHPVPWRTSGKHFGTSRCKMEEWSLKSGESAASRYRVLIVSGPTDVKFVEGIWKEFVGEDVANPKEGK